MVAHARSVHGEDIAESDTVTLFVNIHTGRYMIGQMNHVLNCDWLDPTST